MLSSVFNTVLESLRELKIISSDHLLVGQYHNPIFHCAVNFFIIWVNQYFDFCVLREFYIDFSLTSFFFTSPDDDAMTFSQTQEVFDVFNNMEIVSLFMLDVVILLHYVMEANVFVDQF